MYKFYNPALTLRSSGDLNSKLGPIKCDSDI